MVLLCYCIGEELSDIFRSNTVKYPVLHEPPRLNSLSIDNDLSYYSTFDFDLLQDWLCPSRLADSLQYLHAGGDIDWETVVTFITGLGKSPAIHTLRMSIGLVEEERELLSNSSDMDAL